MRRRQAQGEMYSPCLLLRVSKIRQPGSWTKIFKEELGPQGPQRFTGLPDGQTFLRAGYNLDDPDFWGNVDQYVASTMMLDRPRGAQAAAVEASPGESEGRPTASTVAPGSSRSTTELNGAPASPRGSVGAKILETGGPQSGEMEDHDHVVCLGDTNSRLHWPGHLGGMPLQQARQKVQQRRFGELLALDQLALMRRDRMAFHDFEDGAASTPPNPMKFSWLFLLGVVRVAGLTGVEETERSETALPEDHAVSKAGLSALRFRKLQPREDEVLAALAEQRAAPAPAPAAGGVPKEVWMGYHRLFARDYFERWGHWSTGGPQKLPGAAGAPSPAPAPM
eukprot:g17180.t1